jgi:tetratricopeptide (TPR) repeat protein
MAQLATADGDYLLALREWLPAIRRLPGYRVTVVAALSQAPAGIQPELLRILSRESDLTSRRLEAELRTRWGDPLGGFRALEDALPADRVAAVDALHGLVDQLRGQRTQEALLAQGRALEAIAGRTSEPQSSRAGLEAAQAYSAAGEREAARRMLTGLTADRSTPGSVSSGAAATLLSVLIDEGKLEEARRRLADLGPTLAADEYGALRRRLVEGWIRAGELARADSLLGADSTIEGLALSGRIRLYRGDLRGAIERFKAAGPYAGDRTEATRRTTLLALLQPIEADTLPPLGDALLRLEQGDTAAAMRGLEGVAQNLDPAAGGAELQLLAARLAEGLRKPAEAERLFRAAAAAETMATAPAAELGLAQLLLEQQREGEAVAQLEHLILTYPESALVPQARRVLDQARGAVPRT